MDKHFFFRSGKHRTDGVQSISLQDNKFSAFYKFTYLQTVTAVSLKIKSKLSRSCSSPFSRVSERSHKHVSCKSFLQNVKCFSKFKLTGILEKCKVFFFQVMSQVSIVNLGSSGSICTVYQIVLTSKIYL